MTMAEARQQFATSHLYWHGPGHCWDATPPRHRVVRIKPRSDEQARPDSRDEPKWRNAMSEMLPGDAPAETATAVTLIAPDGPPRLDWLDRWVEVAQTVSQANFDRKGEPPGISQAEQHGDSADHVNAPMRLILMLLVVTLAAVAFLSGNFLHDRRR